MPSLNYSVIQQKFTFFSRDLNALLLLFLRSKSEIALWKIFSKIRLRVAWLINSFMYLDTNIYFIVWLLILSLVEQ